MKTKPESSYKTFLISRPPPSLLFVWDVKIETVWHHLFDSDSNCILCL
jgi:hypothetical protein